MPIHDFICPQCAFEEERFVRGKMSEYDPGACPNGCTETTEANYCSDACLPQTYPVKLEVKFNPGNMAKPIYRGYGWHNSDYGPYSAK